MKNSPLTFLQQPTLKPLVCSNRPGVILVLVVVLLALLTLLGGVYLQIAKVNRDTGRNINTSQLVRDAAIQQIQSALANDLTSINRFFDNTQGIEPYDYPWTNTAVTANFPNAPTAKGGLNDDTWLASSTPDFSTVTDPVWPHITNLTGVFLNLPSPAQTTFTTPAEDILTFASADTTDSSLSILNTLNTALSANYLIRGADADGDGIPDSRWTWAPQRRIGNTEYVMAVRIIDNSSMININSASVLLGNSNDNSWGTTAANRPRGYLPTEADLSRISYRIYNVNQTTTTNELRALFNIQQNIYPASVTNPAFPLPLGLADKNTYSSPTANTNSLRGAAWEAQARLFGRQTPETYPLTIDDEFEFLRYRNGLNSVSFTRPLKSKLPSLLRTTTNENYFGTIVSPITGNSNFNATNIRVWFQGGLASGGATGLLSDSTYKFADFRKMLTTRSGASALAYNYPTGTNVVLGTINYLLNTPSAANSRRLKYNISNTNIGGAGFISTSTNRIESMAERLARIMKISDTNSTATSKYLNLTGAQGDTILNHVALQYALSIDAYSKPSSSTLPSGYFDTTTSTFRAGANSAADQPTHYPLKPLPFIRQAYFQIGYDDQDLRDPAGLLAADPGFTALDGLYDTWVRQNSTKCMVVEIGNPFDTSTDLQNVRINFKSTTTPALNTNLILASTPTPLNSGTNAYIYWNPTTSSFTENGLGASPDIDLNLATKGLLVPAPSAGYFDYPITANQIDGSDITIELQTQVAPGEWRTYDRLQLNGLATPAPTEIQHQPLDTTARPIHAQAAFGRDSRTARYLSNTGKGIVYERTLPVSNSNTTDPSTNYPNYIPTDYKFAVNNGLSGDPKLDIITQIPQPGRKLHSVAEMGWIMMAGFQDSASTSPAWNSATSYAAGQYVSYNNNSWLSLQSANLNNTPGSAPTYWVQNNGDLPELLSTPALGGTDRLFLQINPAQTVIPNVTGLSHATMIFDEFTALNPAYDNVNNTTTATSDNTSTSGLDRIEQFVPGTININTAPLHILTLAAPLPETISDIEPLMTQIINYRAAPQPWNTFTTYNIGQRVTNAGQTWLCIQANSGQTPATPSIYWKQTRPNPGFQSIAETLSINPGTGVNLNQNMLRYGMDTLDNKASVINLYPMPEDTGIPTTTWQDTGTPGTSPREDFSRYQFLSQLFTTRSDIFTAYILIQGYPAGSFNQAPIETSRWIVIFDRSNILKYGDTPRILGMYQVN